MGISGDDEFTCILLPSGSVGCFKSWVFFRLAGILSYETFLRAMKQLFNFIGEHRFFVWRAFMKHC
jgi:hypothetical protein